MPNRVYLELPDVLTPADLMEFLPLGRNAVYQAIKEQRIRSVRCGQKLLITKAALGDFLGLTPNAPVAETPSEENPVWAV